MNTRKNHYRPIVILTGALLFAVMGYAQAGETFDRQELENALGGSAIIEDFESWTGDVMSDNEFTSLDSSTVIAGQGPGIVNSGLLFTSLTSNRDNDGLQLDRRGEYNIPSGSLLGEGGTLVINFLDPVTHVGFDLFQFNGYSDTATVRVFAPDDTTIIFTSPLLDAPNAPASTFFGYTDSDGIGQITVQATSKAWSPLIDDLTYGSITEPADLVAELSETIGTLDIDEATVKSLRAKLDTAAKILDDENKHNDVAAINSLQAFINSVNAQSGKKILEEDADNLVTAAQQIIDVLNLLQN